MTFNISYHVTLINIDIKVTKKKAVVVNISSRRNYVDMMQVGVQARPVPHELCHCFPHLNKHMNM